jgi:hypothetical protein
MLGDLLRAETGRMPVPTLRNACSHSRGTRLDVELNYARDLLARVRDNGIGGGAAARLALKVAADFSVDGMSICRTIEPGIASNIGPLAGRTE